MFRKTTGPDVGLGLVVVKHHNDWKKEEFKVPQFWCQQMCAFSSFPPLSFSGLNVPLVLKLNLLEPNPLPRLWPAAALHMKLLLIGRSCEFHIWKHVLSPGLCENKWIIWGNCHWVLKRHRVFSKLLSPQSYFFTWYDLNGHLKNSHILTRRERKQRIWAFCLMN